MNFFDDSGIKYLLTDSRDLREPSKTVFFALRTAASDGHRYINDLISRGVTRFVVERIPEGLSSVAQFIVCPRPESVLQYVGRKVRDATSAKVIGVTGSVGKTVVKEILYQALSRRFRVTRSPRSYNSQIGVPLSLWEIRPDDDYAIIEAGIDGMGQMAALAAQIRPTVGILTRITDEHSDGFASREEKIRQKLLLFASVTDIVYDGNDPGVESALRDAYPQKRLHAAFGKGDAINPALAVKTMEVLGFDTANIRDMMSEVNATVDTRLDVREGTDDSLVINDRFTADVRSLSASLAFMRRRATNVRHCVLVLGELLRPYGTDEKALYGEVAEVAAEFGVDEVFACNHSAIQYSRLFDDRGIKFAIFEKENGVVGLQSCLILVQGLPSVAAMLETPRHETTLDVNLDALTRNFNHYRSLLRPTTGVIAMVKASAYGIGALEVSKTLQAQGAAYLAVAVVDEGVALRRAGITIPIMVMNPISTNFRALVDYRLEPSVFSLRELEMLLMHLPELTEVDNAPYPIHIKLDTGMHRVGFISEELPDLVNALTHTDRVAVATAFSHLATADCLDQDEYTDMQLHKFEEMTFVLRNGIGYDFKRHILNTAGIQRRTVCQYDFVRLGIGLYGIDPVDEKSSALSVVAALRTRIISLHRWQPYVTIGYGRKGVVARQSVVATVPIGYADGINRHLGCGNASFIVKGVACPTIGNVCMDQCMIDVTDVPEVNIGDSVEIFGPSAPISRLSDTLGTIPYEVLASISPRVTRLYFRE